MMSGLQVEVEIDLAGHPLVVEFGEESADEAQTKICVGKDAGHPGASAQLPVDALQSIGGAQRMRRAAGKSKTARLSGMAVSTHSASFGCSLPHFQGDLQEPFGLRPVGRVKDGAHLGGHRLLGLLAGDELAGILLQMELAALPGHGGVNCPVFCRHL